MDLKIRITVHGIHDERICDDILRPNVDPRGVMGIYLIGPLREINGKEYCINDVRESFKIQELWDWIRQRLDEYSLNYNAGTPGTYEGHYVPDSTFLVFNGLRYEVEDTNKSVSCYLCKMGMAETDRLEIVILVGLDAGEVFEDVEFRYYMHSRETGRHHEPHVHVSLKCRELGTFSIRDGRQLSGNIIRKKYAKVIRETIFEHQDDLVKYWNLHTDGLTVDLNQAWGLRE